MTALPELDSQFIVVPHIAWIPAKIGHGGLIGQEYRN